VLLFLIFLIGFFENGRCEGKKGSHKKKKKKKKKRVVEYLKKKINK
jgi:hypothetical protein